MIEEQDLQKLLRLKRHEQPPPEYFQSFLHEFHRRQRAELLRQPLWQIAWDRATAFFSQSSTSRLAYAAATIAVLAAAGVTSFKIINAPSSTFVAQAIPAAQPRFGLNTRVHLPDFSELSHEANSVTVASVRPRYVMDARPVSYEPASSF